MTGPGGLDRRAFLAVSVAGGLAFGFQRLAQAADGPGGGPADEAPEGFDPALWFRIDEEGVVTVHVPRVEMGQHVGTAMARIVADELGADWAKVKVRHVGGGGRRPRTVTAFSTSVAESWDVLRRAGAAGRRILREGGAAMLGVPVGRVAIARHVVAGGGRHLSFGAVAARPGIWRRFAPEELDHLLSERPPRQLVGRSVTPRDVAAKTRGATRFAGDLTRPGMLHARPKLPPTGVGATILSVDDHAARRVAGYVDTIVPETAGWALVVGESWAAVQAATPLVKVDWKAGPGLVVGEKDVLARGRALVDDEKAGVRIDALAGGFSAGDGGEFRRYYTTATVPHFELEPLSALAEDRDGVMEIVAGCPAEAWIVPAIAKALGRPEEKVRFVPLPLGGNLGRRLDARHLVPLALAARRVGRPIRMTMLREDDMRIENPRAPSVQRLRVALDEGRISGMEHRLCGGWPLAVVAPDRLARVSEGVSAGARHDPQAIAGAVHGYLVGEHRIGSVRNDALKDLLRAGYLRGGGPAVTGWALESFIDEVADRLGEDPLALRLQLLTGEEESAFRRGQAAVLRHCAALAGWEKERPTGEALGVALGHGGDRARPTHVACAALVAVRDGRVKVRRLTLVSEAGIIVDPTTAAVQTESAALLGLALALHEGSEIRGGSLRHVSMVHHRMLRMADVPEVESVFLPSDRPPAGVGEAMAGVVAPAVANAIFRATGVRPRHLPMGPAIRGGALAAKGQSAKVPT